MARQKKPFDAVQFTRESAERIAGVVRQAELSPAAASPLTFDRRLSDRHPKQVRAATFSGSWAINSSKVVTFRYAPTATANVVNLSWPLGGCLLPATDCIVGKEGTSFWLLSINLASLPSYNPANIQMLGHGAAGATASGCMRWYDIANCATATSS